jgi:predicted transcriptional regulator
MQASAHLTKKLLADDALSNERLDNAAATQQRLVEDMRDMEVTFAQLNQRIASQFQDGHRKIESHVKLLNTLRADVEQIFTRIG